MAKKKQNNRKVTMSEDLFRDIIAEVEDSNLEDYLLQLTVNKNNEVVGASITGEVIQQYHGTVGDVN